MMTSSNFTKVNTFLTFFNNDKRLQLLSPFHSHIVALKNNLQRPLNILDVGAGMGLHANYFASEGHFVTAIDPAEEMLQQGKKLYPTKNLEWIVDALPNLTSLNDRKFDVIYSIAAWQYIPPDFRAASIKRMVSLLLPGGLFVIVWPSPASRENQFPLSVESLIEEIDNLNQAFYKDQAIKISQCQVIRDPDKRKGFIEKDHDVYFHTLIGELTKVALKEFVSYPQKSKITI